MAENAGTSETDFAFVLERLPVVFPAEASDVFERLVAGCWVQVDSVVDRRLQESELILVLPFFELLEIIGRGSRRQHVNPVAGISLGVHLRTEDRLQIFPVDPKSVLEIAD